MKSSKWWKTLCKKRSKEFNYASKDNLNPLKSLNHCTLLYGRVCVYRECTDMLCGIRARTPIQTSRTIGGSPPSHSPASWDGTTSSGEVWLVISTGIVVSLSARKIGKGETRTRNDYSTIPLFYYLDILWSDPKVFFFTFLLKLKKTDFYVAADETLEIRFAVWSMH